MPAVQTQQLATVANLDLGPDDAAMVEALAMFSDDAKNEHLRRASGQVLAAYAIRFGAQPGSSFQLATWGDLTIGMVCDLARWSMISQRGYNPANSADKTIKALADAATLILNEISDITNKTPRRDPNASDGTPYDEELGALAHSEGGELDEADHYAHMPAARFAIDGCFR